MELEQIVQICGIFLAAGSLIFCVWRAIRGTGDTSKNVGYVWWTGGAFLIVLGSLLVKKLDANHSAIIFILAVLAMWWGFRTTGRLN